MARSLSPAKKRSILSAARRLLIREGFRDIVLDDVAKAAGVAKGTLFLYYRNKEQLVSSVYADLADRLGEELRLLRDSGRPGRALLEAVVRTLLAHFDRHRDFLSQFQFRSCRYGAGRPHAALSRRFKENTACLAAILRSCARESAIAPRDFEYAAFALIGLCRSAMVLKLMEGHSRPLVDETAKVLGFFLHGARGPGRSPTVPGAPRGGRRRSPQSRAIRTLAVLAVVAGALPPPARGASAAPVSAATPAAPAAQTPPLPPPAPPAGRPLSLSEAYRLALKRSETLAQKEETYKEALARVDELKGEILPHLSLLGTETLQENPNIAGLSAINQTSIPQLQLTATQPLFSGFREFLAFKAGRRQAESAHLTEERAEALLYQDVAQAYLALLQMQKEIVIRRSIVGVTQERIKQLERWVRIGRSRESELLAARSQSAQVEAQIEISRGQERVDQEALKFLTGLEAEERLLPDDVRVPAMVPVESYLEKARLRSDVEAARKDLEAARLATEINRRQRWPTIGATGNYYLKRVGFLGNTHYDALLSASLPLFDGGVIAAQVRETAALQRSDEQALSLAERGAARDVRSAYRGLEWTLASAQALQKAADLGEANVRAQTEDYRLGLVTNLDVLDAITTLESTRILLNQTQLQAVLAGAQLAVAAGEAPR